MDRRQKRNLENNRDKSYITWITWIFIVVGIITFMVSYIMYSNNISEQSKLGSAQRDVTGLTNNLLNVMPNEEVSEVSLGLGKSVNELENSDATNPANNINSETIEKLAVNTSEIENRVVSARQEDKTENTSSQAENTKKEEAIPDPTFIKPVDGEIIKDYSKDNLIYSNTLQEWTTHLGIDYAAEKTSIVKAAADGKIKSIKNDPRYGLTVVIEHTNGFISMYSNLLSTEFITVGEEVKAGQTIATVGNTAVFEIADDTHLHFEILKDGTNVDPNLYIK